MHLLRTSPGFTRAVLVTLGLVGLDGLLIILMQLRPGFLGMAPSGDHTTASTTSRSGSSSCRP